MLGLDLSTSCVGYCVLESSDLSIVELGHISLKKIDGLFNKVDSVVPKILVILDSLNVDRCVIEESVQAFTPGFSSAHTILTLAKFNALVSYGVRKQLGDANISFVKPGEARKTCDLVMTTKKKAGVGQKEQTFQQLTAPNGLLSHITWDMTKTGKVKPESYDRADAFVVAFHGATKQR